MHESVHACTAVCRPFTMLTKRLRSEYKSLVKNPDPDIVLQPHEENLRHWVAHIRGPADSPFHNGVFRLRVEAGLQYPMTPPSISFETKIFHPNVHFKARAIAGKGRRAMRGKQNLSGGVPTDGRDLPRHIEKGVVTCLEPAGRHFSSCAPLSVSLMVCLPIRALAACDEHTGRLSGDHRVALGSSTGEPAQLRCWKHVTCG